MSELVTTGNAILAVKKSPQGAFIDNGSMPELWQGAVHIANRQTDKSEIERIKVGGVKGTRAGVASNAKLDLNFPHLPGALCVNEDPDLHQPLRSDAFKQIALAKAVCEDCPVKQKCLDWCLEFEQTTGEIQTGVWGGVSEWERKRPAVKQLENLCRNNRHAMTGENVAVLADGSKRCKACKAGNRIKNRSLDVA